MIQLPWFWIILAVVLLVLALATAFLWKLRGFHRLEGEWLKQVEAHAKDDPQVRALQNAQWLSGRVSSHDEWLRNVLAFLGAVGILGGIAFTWYQFQETLRTNADQVKAGRQGQVAEQVRSAIEGFGHEEESVRVGNLLLLERLSREEPDLYGNIAVEIIASFIRRRGSAALGVRARGQNELWPPQDVRSALAILGRRANAGPGKRPEELPDLRGVFLVGADLKGLPLKALRFEDAYFTEANLADSDVSYSVFRRAHLEEVSFFNATMLEADFQDAVMTEAILSLVRAQRTSFLGAQLQGARLLNPQLAGANVRGANLSGADLLTLPQLEAADGDGSTVLPPSLLRPPRWSR